MPATYWRALDIMAGPYCTRSATLQRLVAEAWAKVPLDKRKPQTPPKLT